MQNKIRLLVFVALIPWAANATVAKEQTAGIKQAGLVAEQPSGQRSVATDDGYMIAYSEQIPGTDITFEMIPVPGGEFLLGSPDSEANRDPDEGPQVRVVVEPFWMGRYEITWAEYQVYMNTYNALKSLNELRVERNRFGEQSEKLKNLPKVNEFLASESLDIDGITAPTPLYEPDVTYAVGQEPDQPAVTMSQFAAKQYTKWLSGITQHQYRLPTEAEWEYAARAGTTTPYSFAPENSLDDYAWYAANSDDQLQAVGSKLPNAWGLHDMHGNVAEWVLDEYVADRYSQLKDNTTIAKATRWPTQLYPRVIRGGCWFDEPARCRTAARHQSDDPEWTVSDPNLPISPWWFTEEPASGVGFRLVRPLKKMDEPVRKKVWDADIEDIRLDVNDRLMEGRGTQSATNPHLPAALQELEEAGLID